MTSVDYGRIGIDFGTTNSLLSFLNPLGETELFDSRMGSDGIVPTFALIERKGVTKFVARLFGRQAQEEFYDETRTSSSVENFKLRLPHSGSYIDDRRKHEAYTLSKSFLSQFLREYMADRRVASLTDVVMTVPENWLRSDEQIGPKALRDIMEELDFPEPLIISEPVAAAAYFVDKWRYESQDPPFKGHLLVYDHGGGTVDFALVEVDGQTVKPLLGGGISTEIDRLGLGGSAYDRYVFEHVDAGMNLSIDPNSKKARSWIKSFETQKNAFRTRIATELHALRKNEPVESFVIKGVEARAKFPSRLPSQLRIQDLATVFDTKIAPAVKAALRKFYEDCRNKHDIITDDPNRFRILMVGGFSQFPFVRELVEDTLSGSGERHRAHLITESQEHEHWSSVARGAAIVSSGRVNVEETFQMTLGLVTFPDGATPDYSQRLSNVGDPIGKYRSVQWLDRPFGIHSLESELNPSIRFFVERSGEPVEIDCFLPFRNALPGIEADTDSSAKQWKFGCGLRDGEVVIYISEILSEGTDKGVRAKQKFIRLGAFFTLRTAAANRGKIEPSIEDA